MTAALTSSKVLRKNTSVFSRLENSLNDRLKHMQLGYLLKDNTSLYSLEVTNKQTIGLFCCTYRGPKHPGRKKSSAQFI